MIKLYYILATFLFKLVTSDIEYFNNQDDATYKQPGDFHINKVFYNCSDGATKLWDHLKSEIDTNRDGQIDLAEMEIYLNKIILNERKEEAEELIEKLDPSKIGLIGFSSYANETFGSAIIEILAVDDHTENLKELKILYGLEKAKWTNLSSTDEMLNYANFYEFLFADESPKLKDLEKEISFRAYDTNNDGFLNIDEFTAAIKDYDETIIKESKNKKPSLRQFTNKIDLNGDNQIDLEEFKAWITFPSKQKLIEEEETFLFDSCDLNKNGFLEQHEIEETCSRLVKSQLILNREITSSNKNITKHRHDEL